MASDDSVQKIKDRLSIVDVVAPYVELQRSGKTLKGRCPFHSEKTPSFHVSEERNTYHCFGCQAGGDIFTFVQAMEGLDFKGALQQLAERAGVALNPVNPQERNERDTGYAALEAATRSYEAVLSTHAAAREYLASRGVTAATIAKWRIGYAPPEWRKTADTLRAQGFATEVLARVGLVKGEAGKEPYDVFRDRIMFPIADSAGRVVAFSGRILSKDSDAPKYVNSPETPFFSKSHILFGYDKAKQSIRSMNFSLIVEGQFDVVMSHQAGYTNTVAVSGTALTPDHVTSLQRLSSRVVLALDADRAGIAAGTKAAELMLRRGMDVKVARLPLGMDPADVVQKDTAAYKKAIGSAVHIIEFLLEHVRATTTDERTFKLRVREQVLPFVAHIQNQIDREHFEHLIAGVTKTTFDAIHAETNRIIESGTAARPAVASSQSSAHIQAAPLSEERLSALQCYMLAALEVVKSPLKEVLLRALTAISGNALPVWREHVDQASLRAMVFSLEASSTSLSARQFEEELVTRLNELQKLLLKQSLKEAKDRLAEAERLGDERGTTRALLDVRTISSALAKPPITTEDFRA
jgi:DNA primase